ncbi:MAG TPA: hypothetical protein VK175_07220 [Leadbetterella sp.]|nr:hypothetical protein [Leadbetterella sp.]
MKNILIILITCYSCVFNSETEKEFDSVFFENLESLTLKSENIDLEGELDHDKIEKEYKQYKLKNKFNFEDLNGQLSPEKYDYNCMLLASKFESRGILNDSIFDIEHKYKSDSTIIYFKTHNNCCSNTKADFELKNGKINIVLHPVTNIACDCNCGFEYKFSVKDKSKSIKVGRISFFQN